MKDGKEVAVKVQHKTVKKHAFRDEKVIEVSWNFLIFPSSNRKFTCFAFEAVYNHPCTHLTTWRRAIPNTVLLCWFFLLVDIADFVLVLRENCITFVPGISVPVACWSNQSQLTEGIGFPPWREELWKDEGRIESVSKYQGFQFSYFLS